MKTAAALPISPRRGGAGTSIALGMLGWKAVGAQGELYEHQYKRSREHNGVLTPTDVGRARVLPKILHQKLHIQLALSRQRVKFLLPFTSREGNLRTEMTLV